MEKSKVEQPWEQEEDLEEGLRVIRKTLNQAQFTTDSNGNGDFNNGEEEEEEEEEEKVKGSGQQNGIKIDEDEQERQQDRSEYCVYYDTDKGIWKCRICSWDYEGRTCLTGHTRDPNWHSHMPVNEKTVDQQRPCFIREAKGTELHFESSVAEENPAEDNIDVTRQHQENGNTLNSVTSKQNGEHQKHNNFPHPSLRPSEILFEELDKSFMSNGNNVIESAGTEVIKDGVHEVDEFDVETVLRKQETHDLYCPNCNSCITKRVILRKRKRRTRTPGEDAKRNKPETLIPSEPNVVSVESNNNQAQNGVDLDLSLDENQRELDVFRCLSCFSIFVPTGNGFKLFRMFGDKSDEEKSQRSQKSVRVKKGWFSSIFSSDKMETLTDHGAGHSLEGENNVGGTSVLSSNLDEQNGLASPRQEANSSSLSEPKGHIAELSQLVSSMPSASGDNNAHSSTQGPAIIEQVIADESENAIKKGKGAGHSLDGENNVGGASLLSSNLNEQKGLASLRQEASSSSLNEPKGQISEVSQWDTQSISPDNDAPFSTQGPAIIEQMIADESDSTVRRSNGEAITDRVEVHTVDQLIPSYHMQSNSKHGVNTIDQSVTSYHMQSNSETGVNTVDQLTTLYHMESNGKNEVNTVDQSSITYHTQSDGTRDHSGTPAENASASSQQDGLKFLVPSNVGSSIVENVKMNQKLDVAAQRSSPDITSEVSQQHVMQNNVDIHIAQPLKVDNDASTSPTRDALLFHDKHVKLHKDLRNIGRTTGKDSIITIESSHASAPQISPDTLAMAGTRALQHIGTCNRTIEEGGTATAMQSQSLNIIKSIVYGGLMESIASLSVVASAAGSGATTLNVLALGMANIFGGLFVISHDLWDLRNECTRGASDAEPRQPDRYQQLLGRRADFPFHAAVAFVSYFIFGLLPPLVYGFSFQASNDRNLKLLTVEAASVVCIMTLAVGKAHVQRPRKSYIKTIAYYVVFGFMVSGVSYVFGDLVMKLLEQLDIFHSVSVVNLDLPGASSTLPLATY